MDIKDLVSAHNQLWDQKISIVALKRGYDISSKTTERYHTDLRCALMISWGRKPFAVWWILYTERSDLD